MTDRISLEGTYSSVVNFAMQQNYVPLVKRLVIKNLTDEEIENVEVSITAEPSFAYEWKTRIDAIPANHEIDLDTVNIKLSPDFLYSLTEKLVGTIFIKITQGEKVLASVTQDIGVLAYDEWSGSMIMPEIVCAFITPNHPTTTDIVIKAGRILQKWSGSPSFTGYQSNNPNTVKTQMAAIYAALQKESIAYCMPPASYENAGQRVRLCDSVLSQKLGTCLDLSLLYASCLEAVGLHPIIIFIKGHAFAGCWLEEQCFAECVQDDISLLTKRVAEGINEICLVECTCLVAGKTILFDDAVKAGRNHLLDTEKFELFVDVKRTRGSGIRPIPLRHINEDGQPIYENFNQNQNESSNDIAITNVPEALEVFQKVQHVEHVEITRQHLWERKLLDLSLRNTLLNFRVTKNAIQLMVSHLSKLEDALSDGQEFQIMARPKDWENTLRDSKIFAAETQSSAIESLSRTEFANRRIRTYIEENEVADRITNLYRKAKVSLEENGSNTLYLALGFLKWYESDVSEKERYAPLVLIPIDIIRKSAQKGYVIRVRDEEPQMNITLLEMLRQDFGLSIAGLDPLPADESGIDLKLIFNVIRQSVMDKSRWDVEEIAFIGLFSFSQFIMWNDMRNRAEDLKKNKIVASLISGKMEWEAESDFPTPHTLDSAFAPADLAVPISADSSQLSAICAAAGDNSFVLHGPPGTGKSQTITNIISNALFHGKTVLFIAEKMAALSVVQRRLTSIGLAPFCLELHSNKATKKDVLGQLEQALNIGKIESPEAYEEQAKRLYTLRQKLNTGVEAFHKKRSYGFSLYEAITRFEQYRKEPDCIKVTREQLGKFNQQSYILWTDLLSQFKVAGTECGGAHNHPLYAFTNSSYSQTIRNELGDILKTYISELGRFQNLVSQLCRLLTISMPNTHTQISALVSFAQLFNGNSSNIGATMPIKLFEYEELLLLKDKVNTVCSCGKKRDEIKKRLLEEFHEDILAFDEISARQQWKEVEASWFLPRFWGQGKVLKKIKTLTNNHAALHKEQVLEILDLITEYKTNAKSVEEQSTLFIELYGLLWNKGNPDWQTISDTYVLAVSLNRQLSLLCPSELEKEKLSSYLSAEAFDDLAAFKQKNRSLLHNLENSWEILAQLQDTLSDKTGTDFMQFENIVPWLNCSLQRAGLWASHLDRLRNWCSYLSLKEQVVAAGLDNVVKAYEDGIIQEEQILPAFYRALFLACAIEIVDAEKCLSGFNGGLFENEIAKYKQTCDEFENLTRNELVARLSAKIPPISGSVANSSEVGILQKAIRSGGRMLSIRRLFDSIPTLLHKLCPCMLMSPISVAQYIDPKYPPFDLVIFDEASQMPTCEAVGAIARGKNVIVVGDPKQLPPTSFFNANHMDEDNFEQEDLESILDDCLAISMPQEHLLWHYRSRHESLIAFSNMQYYDNKLFTFPSPNDLVSEVKLVQVEGYYDRGKTKQNKAEAEAVVAEISRRLADPTLRSKSIGVVTFSSVQQNLIDDLLMEAFAKNPQLEEISNQLQEPIFIKNLENVQGDERDVILFSIGYGPDENGKVTLNFGPLNRDGGWRRLNVVVSRAREQMIVFSTLRPEMIELSKTRAQGVAGLKAFLEFAQKGKGALPTKLSSVSSNDNNLERIIAEKIRMLGYEVRTNIGSSQYKIDIGVVHPNKPDGYILGIMCDGRKYYNSATARDRNILQNNVLKSLGWNIYRLWILDWWENPNKELEKIKLALQNALENKQKDPKPEVIKMPSVLAYASEQHIKMPQEMSLPDLTPYITCTLTPVIGGTEGFCLPQNNQLILLQIEQVIAQEAPISRKLLCKRVLTSWGITRIGSRINRRFNELFAIMHLQKTVSSGAEFYWAKGQHPNSYSDFRTPIDEQSRRNMEDIPVEELSEAVKYVLQNQISLLKTDLIREVYKMFGFARGSSSIEQLIETGIEMAMKRGFITVDDAGRVTIQE